MRQPPKWRQGIGRARAAAHRPPSWKQMNGLAWLVEAAAVLELPATTATADADLATLARTLLDAVEQSDRVVHRCLEEGGPGARAQRAHVARGNEGSAMGVAVAGSSPA